MRRLSLKSADCNKGKEQRHNHRSAAVPCQQMVNVVPPAAARVLHLTVKSSADASHKRNKLVPRQHDDNMIESLRNARLLEGEELQEPKIISCGWKYCDHISWRGTRTKNGLI